MDDTAEDILKGMNIPFGMSYMEITPLMAKALLQNNHNTRAINPFRVQELASIISQGKWKGKKSIIEVSKNDCLLNGQHRLSAIVMTDTAVMSLVYKYNPKPAVSAKK